MKYLKSAFFSLLSLMKKKEVPLKYFSKNGGVWGLQENFSWRGGLIFKRGIENISKNGALTKKGK